MIEIQELLARKYDIYYILNLEFEEGLMLIDSAFRKELEEALWERWLVDYKNMTKDTFISFEDYKSKFMQPKILIKESKEELLKMYNDIQLKSKRLKEAKNGNRDI